jgi:hypothetical protein
MTHPLGGEDFFILEAGEYLGRLSTMANSPGAPSADEIVRFARALRGSAQMAAQQPIARAASALEQVLRGVRDGQIPWNQDVATLTRQTIVDIRGLVDRVKRWSNEDAAIVDRITAELEAFKSGAMAPAPKPAPSPETGIRAFLAREAAAIGSVLAQAAHAVRGGVTASDPADAVLRRMHSLQGMAALNDYPPLPDLLDGIERLCRSIAMQQIGRVEGASQLDGAAEALGRTARDVAEHGRLDLEAAELLSFARRLLAPALAELPIVPIETLYPEGEDGIVSRGSSPRGTAALLSAAAVVSRGERLFQTADDLASAVAAVPRDLRLHRLLGELSGLSSGLPPGLDTAVESFAVAARAAVARGDASLHRTRYAALLREAGERLRGYDELSEPMKLAGAFERATRSLDLLGTPEESPAAATVASPAGPPPVPIEELAPEQAELPIVPIESLLYEEAVTPAPVGATPLPPAPVPHAPEIEGWDLVASFSHYEVLLRRPAVAAIPAAPARASDAEEGLDDLESAAEVVSITQLLYGGPRALAEADRIRRRIRAAVAAEQPPAVIQPLFEELLDLVELAAAG